ncbi:MAG: hypothetical protein IT384_11405 [Deltaproteobacteria bacterium]|nr:hypothetical protein [Deltaproteobacteria bacterium]
MLSQTSFFPHVPLRGFSSCDISAFESEVARKFTSQFCGTKPGGYALVPGSIQFGALPYNYASVDLQALPIIGTTCAGNLRYGEPVAFHGVLNPRSGQMEGTFSLAPKAC